MLSALVHVLGCTTSATSVVLGLALTRPQGWSASSGPQSPSSLARQKYTTQGAKEHGWLVTSRGTLEHSSGSTGTGGLPETQVALRKAMPGPQPASEVQIQSE
jgi:hypothetical protein